MLSIFVIAFLPRRKDLLISWLLSPSAVILEPKKIKSVTVSRGQRLGLLELCGLPCLLLWGSLSIPLSWEDLSKRLTQELLYLMWRQAGKQWGLMKERWDLGPLAP